MTQRKQECTLASPHVRTRYTPSEAPVLSDTHEIRSNVKMTFDVSKYAQKIQNAQSARVDRDWISPGDHVIKIEAVVSMTSENTGNDLVIIEGEIVSTKGETHRRGDKVKQMFALSGVPAWKVDENIGQLKSIVMACLPEGAEVDTKLISKALQGGEDSALSGDCIRVIAKRKTSKKGASFTQFSYVRVEEQAAHDWSAAASTTQPINDDSDMPF